MEASEQGGGSREGTTKSLLNIEAVTGGKMMILNPPHSVSPTSHSYYRRCSSHQNVDLLSSFPSFHRRNSSPNRRCFQVWLIAPFLVILPCASSDASAEACIQDSGTKMAGVRPFLRGMQGVLQGNNSIVAAAATAAGVQVLKRAMSNSALAGGFQEMFTKKESLQASPAVMQDDRGLPTSIPFLGENLRTIQWLPAEWQDWGQHKYMQKWSRATEELTEQARLQWKEGAKKVETQLRELSKMSTWEELQRIQPLLQPWGGRTIDQRLKAWQDTLSIKIEHFRTNILRAPRSRRAELAASAAEVDGTNKMLLGRLFTVLAGDGWEHVLHQDGVDVYRKRIVDLYQGGEKFYCVKAVGVIDAKAADIYELLKDSARVDEYNDECAQVRDLSSLSPDTKVTWAASKTYFPFKPRDFVTRVHNTQLKDGTYVVMSRSEDVDFTDGGADYVRTEVLLAGNVMRPCPDDPNKTEFTTIAHINPGGAADTPLGAQITNRICIHGPVSFIRKIETVCGKGGVGQG
uniref:START domain-containing protein n=1 Tax=Hanusia phi TaxID=3032 RepID=A0A7S0EY86_9CRYP